ncbi:hypothetical protein [Sphingobacterium rhinopitheci]|uniref:hypothetical protein n=1 Tax=Sphingobacterium rhinopitheci TaxID=2781960 RepID=UPI001F52553E|nr:hypothetical protein [Sphingobacterium rhinopitheci]MCI0921113.1 hypothetical protein [Sphingobacterium rhinopitheci]
MKINSSYFLLLLISVFTACSDSDNISPDENSGGPSSNSYWPLKIGNQWDLVNTEDNTDKMDYFVHKTLVHDGKTYFQFKPIGIEDDDLTYGFREENGIFYDLHGVMSHNGITISAGTLISMNLNLNVGQVWKDEITLDVTGVSSGTVKHINEGKILDKVDNVTINGKNYKDIIKTETKKTIINSISSYTTVITYETWLSKGIGIIFEKTTYAESDQVSYGLVNYALK